MPCFRLSERWRRQQAGDLKDRPIRAPACGRTLPRNRVLLVQGSVLHPKIEPTGTSEKIRNGVGVRDGQIVVFAISDEPVTFYRFASLFRDKLNCPDALFLDGSISSLFAPELGRADGLLPLGPMVGVVEQAR
jgi:uncharacterized protein YigE (DUF2233 family)